MPAPSAALTIHPAISETAASDLTTSVAEALTEAKTVGTDTSLGTDTLVSPHAAASSQDPPNLAAKSATAQPLLASSPPAAPAVDVPLESSPQSGPPQLLAQLSPDQVVAQASDQGGTLTATPIPPVVTGVVDLEEFKTTNVIELKTSQSRTFKLKNKIVRTSISDPAIAEPVVVSENQIVLLGKTPGTATLVMWDDAGNSVAIDLRVSRDYSQLQSMLREIDPRIIVKAYSVGGTDRVILLGDVDHPDSVIRAFAASDVFMDDRGMTIQVANSRLLAARIGEQGGTAVGGGQAGQLAALSSVDRYTFFPNLNNNISKAQVIVSDGGRVTSLVKVRKVPVIVLHVSFMEMNSTAAREIGIMLGTAFTANGMSFGVGGTNSALSSSNSSNVLLTATPGSTTGYNVISVPGGSAVTKGASTQGVNFIGTTTGANDNSLTGLASSGSVYGIGLGVLNSASSLVQQAVLFGSPGGAGFNSTGLANLYQGTSLIRNKTAQLSLNPTIQGLISHSRARVLAEPTLVTISGERAAFLAGGEIPIIQSIATAGASQQSVTFEPFGLRINMIPILMENGSLNLEISPEERIPSTQFGLNVPGSTTTIPGFTTRKAQTIVEMRPGQELFIAGLITANAGRELDKTPILGEIPVIGALYRSKAFSKNESELVVAIRPEIILPGTPGQLKLPEEIGRVEGPRDTNLFQVEPTVVDERHYTSGRDERHQKTSPTLPEGSPVPDNE
jgi:Flp pilus assembly secretin CpaC